MNTTDRVDWRVVAPSGGFRWGREGEDVVAEWGGLLTLRASANGEVVAWNPEPGARNDLVEKVRFGVASAFLRALRGDHSLHAAAVSHDGLALVCVGESGTGKSTLAGSLCQMGARLLADDIAGIKEIGSQWQAVPSEPALWLRHDGSTGKTALHAPAANGPAPIRWVVALSFEDGVGSPALQPLHGAAALSALVGAMIRFEATPCVWQREFDVAGGLLTQARVLKLTRSRLTSPEAAAEMLIALTLGRNE